MRGRKTGCGAALLVPFQLDTPAGYCAPIRNGRRFHIPDHVVEIVGTALVCLTLGKVVGSIGVADAVEAKMAFVLTSSAFDDGKPIPSQYTCDGQDLSLPFAWTVPPAGTKSLALINDDPDAPMGTWVHWVVYNIPPSVRQLPEAFPADPERPDGTRQGTTDFGRIGYGGPCPPSGTHRYFFTLYALDAVLPLSPGATKAKLEAAMEHHVLAQTQLMGTYRRKNREP